MRKLAWAFVVVVGLLHYDFWLWDDTTLVLGFVPIGLAYHALISILAAAGWLLVVRFAWPEHVEEWARGASDAAPAPTDATTGGGEERP